MHPIRQSHCAWCGIAALLFFFSGFLAAGFIPVPPPSLTPEEVAAMYQQNATGIGIGGLCFLISGMFIAPLVGVISVQLRRTEHSKAPALSYVQLSAGTAGIMFFMVSGIFFLITNGGT